MSVKPHIWGQIGYCDRLTDRQSDICNCRVAIVTKKFYFYFFHSLGIRGQKSVFVILLLIFYVFWEVNKQKHLKVANNTENLIDQIFNLKSLIRDLRGLGNGRTDSWTDSQTDSWIDRQTDRWTDGWASLILELLKRIVDYISLTSLYTIPKSFCIKSWFIFILYSPLFWN